MTTQTPPQSGGSREPRAHRYPPPPPSPPSPPPASQPPTYGQPAPPPLVNGPATQVKPPTYWPLSIIAFIFSILFGAIGMYFSAQVTSRWNAGDGQGAQKASKTALILDLIGLAIGVLVLIATLSSGGGSSTY